MLVAGLGNVFLSDDGFGVEVVRRLEQEDLPQGVKVMDVGIRGVHLAYELIEGYDCVVMVDVLSGDDEPGTLYVFEPDLQQWEEGGVVDAHDMDPRAVLSFLGELGGEVGRVLIVGCEPADLSEGMELSRPVAQAVPGAVEVVMKLVTEKAAAFAGKGNP